MPEDSDIHMWAAEAAAAGVPARNIFDGVLRSGGGLVQMGAWTGGLYTTSNHPQGEGKVSNCPPNNQTAYSELPTASLCG